MTRSEKRAFWYRHCEAALSTEQSNADYARAHGLELKKFYNWLVSYRKAIAAKPSFVKVETEPTPKKTSSTCLTISMNGIVLTFDVLPDVRWLADFVLHTGVQS